MYVCLQGVLALAVDVVHCAMLSMCCCCSAVAIRIVEAMISTGLLSR